jgi:hypothetical protein
LVFPPKWKLFSTFKISLSFEFTLQLWCTIPS